jgi:CO dehydrogenase maturation factor
MKICICGKGGCGKSVLTALLARYIQKIGKRAFVIDSDESNSALYWMLGLGHPPLSLMDYVGGRKAVQEQMSSQSSSGKNEAEMSMLRREEIPNDSIPSDYVSESEGCRLVAVGKIHQALEGCACAMGVVSKEFLKKLRLDPDQVALADMEAGIEHFGRGIETGVDVVLAVVEPSLESMYLAEKIEKLTTSSGARFGGAVLNKIDSEQTAEHLAEQIAKRGVPIAGVIMYHREIAAACLEGRPLQLEPALQEIRGIVDGALHLGR